MKPKYIDKCLTDGDIICYRASASAENKLVEDAYNSIDDLMGYIINETVVFPTSDSFKVYLSGQGNFRHTVAKTHGYKANRTQPKPIHLPAARDYLVKEYGAVISSGCEADDLIAMEAMKGDPDATVIASIDKDYLTVPVWMFNFVKGTWEKPTEWEALCNFYEQILTGDVADNVKGIYRVGPVKARKIMEGAEDEIDLYNLCVEAYAEDFRKNGYACQDFIEYTKAEERVLENAQLLHLQRYKGEMWEPPNGDKDK